MSCKGFDTGFALADFDFYCVKEQGSKSTRSWVYSQKDVGVISSFGADGVVLKGFSRMCETRILGSFCRFQCMW